MSEIMTKSARDVINDYLSARKSAQDAFEESKHPRSANGQFGSGSGGAGSEKSYSASAMKKFFANYKLAPKGEGRVKTGTSVHVTPLQGRLRQLKARGN